MRHAGIRTTMSYGDVITNPESDALAKITAMTSGKGDKQYALYAATREPFIFSSFWRREWDSNPRYPFE